HLHSPFNPLFERTLVRPNTAIITFALTHSMRTPPALLKAPHHISLHKNLWIHKPLTAFVHNHSTCTKATTLCTPSRAQHTTTKVHKPRKDYEIRL
ncbi:MAG: hypothetical protein MR006_03445, partial [Arcanobacterium sp.]|nr:hypothetical protein [Arcanobacterium sp.]